MFHICPEKKLFSDAIEWISFLPEIFLSSVLVFGHFFTETKKTKVEKFKMEKSCFMKFWSFHLITRTSTSKVGTEMSK